MIIINGNAKGGVGKTTVTANLAAALATGRNKLRVCVVDFDFQSNLTHTIIKPGVAIETSMFSILNGDSPPIEDCIYPTVHENLDLIPSKPALSALEIPMSKTFPKSATIFRDFAREYLLKNYDVVLCDVGPNINIVLYQALCVADALFIIVEIGDYYSLMNIETLVEHISGVQEELNPDLQDVKIILNRLNRARKVDEINRKRIFDKFDEDDCFKTIIPVSADFRSIVEKQGLTIFKYKPKSKGAAAFRSLAKEVIDEYSIGDK